MLDMIADGVHWRCLEEEGKLPRQVAVLPCRLNAVVDAALYICA